LPALEPDFAPATVRLSWQSGHLLIHAELTDHDIHTTATADNQNLWELGDTFEIFCQTTGNPGYHEFHVAPNNHRLQLRFPGQQLLTGDHFTSQTTIEPRQWRIQARIPGAVAGAEWRVSFSRYDYTRGRVAPVISSTSLHKEPNFHRHHEWSILRFEP
jgi:hypothetical protein